MPNPTKVIAISGSLRRLSYNTAALRACKEIAAPDLDIDIVTLEDIPFFSADVEEEGYPPPVAALQQRVGQAQAVLFATPEYNYSVTGVLKNAIDWLSRPPGKSALRKKPAGIIGASSGMIGTARAQAHLRQILYYNAMPVLPYSEVLIARAQERFDQEGRLTDEETRGYLRDFLQQFAEWVAQHPA